MLLSNEITKMYEMKNDMVQNEFGMLISMSENAFIILVVLIIFITHILNHSITAIY